MHGHLCRELREVYAGTCERAPAAASPALAEAAAVDFIMLEARLGDAPAPVPAASLPALQYTVVRALSWRRQQLLGLLAAGKPYLYNPTDTPDKQPAPLTPITPGRVSARTPSGTATSAGVTGQGNAASEGLTLEGARALEWVEASDLAAQCASVLLHQVTSVCSNQRRIIAALCYSIHLAVLRLQACCYTCMAALVATSMYAVQDPAAFAAQHTAHFGGAGALPLTQLLLVDSPEPTRLLVTLAACPRTPPEAANSHYAASAPRLSRTEQPAPPPTTSKVNSEVESAECTASASAPALAGASAKQCAAAEGAAPDIRDPGAASAGVALGREGAPPCQLTLERFDWRSTQPEVLELAAWDARNCWTPLDAGREESAEATAGQACAARDGRSGAPGSESRADSRSAGHQEPDACHADGKDPALAGLEPPEQPERTACHTCRNSSRLKDPALLRLATGTSTGYQLDLPRGRHLLRLRAGFGRGCAVELRSCSPFCAGDAVQVGLPALHHQHK